MVTVSLCICTRDRPVELERCLSSVAAGAKSPEAVVVSDDGNSPAETKDLVESLGEPFKYVAGPRRGLAANRNNCLSHVGTSHVAFIDDDVLTPNDFVSSLATAAEASREAVVTGWERRLVDDRTYARITPHDADFWGLQRRPPGGSPRSIVINATVFPMALFDQIRFDERLQYGSEEIDIAQHAAALGVAIRFDESLWVEHRPSREGRDGYSGLAESSRIYQNIKRFAAYEESPLRALVFAVLDPARVIMSGARRGGPAGATRNARSAVKGLTMAVDAALARWRPTR